MTEQLQTELAQCRAGLAARLIGISHQTLNNWRRDGRIAARKDPSGRWHYDVRPFLMAKEC
jgi:predicted site-specific integrase-resolvase